MLATNFWGGRQKDAAVRILGKDHPGLEGGGTYPTIITERDEGWKAKGGS